MILALIVSVGLSASPTTVDADRLFSRARELMKTDPRAACPLFDASFVKDPALGTLLNLALCLEAVDRPASAWLKFNEAQAWAARTHEAEREHLAKTHLAALKPRVAWLALSFTQQAPGLETTVDGQVLSVLGAQSVPLDPGSHSVKVTAPGFESWQTQLQAPPAGESVSMRVPALQSTTAAAVEPSSPPPPVAESFDRPAPVVRLTTPVDAPSRASAGVMLGVGGALLAASGLAMAVSLDTVSKAQGQRVGVTQPTMLVTQYQFETARTLYTVAWAGLAAGVAATGIGVWLLIRPSHTTVAFVPSARGATFALSTTF